MCLDFNDAKYPISLSVLTCLELIKYEGIKESYGNVDIILWRQLNSYKAFKMFTAGH